MRGLRPMSPKTRICTLGLSFVAGSYCEGSSRISTVSALERQNAMLMRSSIITRDHISKSHKLGSIKQLEIRKLRRARNTSRASPITSRGPHQGARRPLVSACLDFKVLEAHLLAVLFQQCRLLSRRLHTPFELQRLCQPLAPSAS